MGYKFGKSSSAKLATAHPDLQKVMELAISRSPIDFGIAYGYRSPEEQLSLFKIGRREMDDGTWEVVGSVVTNRDGTEKASKHNSSPSHAVDIFIYHPDPYWRNQIVYDLSHMSYVAGIIASCAHELFQAKEITHQIIWGGNWSNDGIILKDQGFDDIPHFEIK